MVSSTEPDSGTHDGAVTGIDIACVTAWFAQNVAEVEGALRFTLIAGGHSNLTFHVEDEHGATCVLRRPPTGHVLATAHDMAREHKIISGVGGTAVPVPKTLGLCVDEGVNGAPYYVMEFVPGAVLHDEEAAGDVGFGDRAALGGQVIDILAALHLVNPDDVGLGDLGRREDYIARQLRRWSRQWEQSKTRELPAMETAHRLLAERIPVQVGASIVHGDYRLGNMIVTGPKVMAVLDWELCTLGDPMADVGYLLNNWISPGEPPVSTSGPTAAGGFGSRDRLLDRYADLTGRDLSAIGYFRAFSYWRSAAIAEGVMSRYLSGAMGDQEADTDLYKTQVENLASTAMTLLES